jgi:hypothetical protein
MNVDVRTAPMNVYMLLDRTGSMASIWSETLSSINGYVAKLAADKVDARITLAMFDSNDGTQFDVIRGTVDVKDWPAVTDAEASPRGYTPLYDAIGRLMGLANADASDRASVIIVTDGQENASREVTREGAKAMLDRVQAKGWDVVFLGANFDAFSQAASLGGVAGQTLNIAPGSMQAAMAGPVAARSRSYHIGGAAAAFSDEDRKIASKK